MVQKGILHERRKQSKKKKKEIQMCRKKEVLTGNSIQVQIMKSEKLLLS